jgi:hypothetical protein
MDEFGRGVLLTGFFHFPAPLRASHKTHNSIVSGGKVYVVP